MSDTENMDFAAFEQQVKSGETPVEAEKPEIQAEPEAEKPEIQAEPEGEAEKAENEAENEVEKPKKHASDRIKELNKRLRDEQREKSDLLERIERLEKGLPTEKSSDNVPVAAERPDPTDLDKYPLGSLDDRYIEDMIEHVASAKAAEQLESVLRREQEKAQAAEAEKEATRLRQKAENVAAKGIEVHADYMETVVEPAMRGDYALTQTTFEAIADADNGAAILRELALDPVEALRVANLSPYQQIRYVAEKDGKIGGTPAARRIPGAVVPPSVNIKGGGSRSTFDPATASFADFEKQVNAQKR